MNNTTQTQGHGIRRLLGYLLMLASALGLVLSIAGLVLLPGGMQRVEDQINRSLSLSLASLGTSDATIALVGQALGEAADGVGTLQSATGNIQTSLNDTNTALASVHTLLEDDLPGVVETTQSSLRGAEQSARVVERVLYSLNDFALFTGREYDPDVSLTESIASIADSLSGLPDTYEQMAADVQVVQGDLDDVTRNLGDLTTDIGDIETTLRQTQEELENYHLIITDLTLSLEMLQEQVPRWLRNLRWAVMLLLMWLALAQVGLLFQGWEMVTFDRQALEQRIARLEAEMEVHHSSLEEQYELPLMTETPDPPPGEADVRPSCPHCDAPPNQQAKAGKSSSGRQRYRCKNCGRGYTPN